MAEWQLLNCEYGIGYYDCSECRFPTAVRYHKCPKCKSEMENKEDITEELLKLYGREVKRLYWREHWAKEREKGIQMTKGGLANAAD